jgi:hypothetical protein
MKMVKLLAFLLLICTVLISCDQPKSTILTSLKNQNVVIASGINFETGKAVVFSPFTEKEVKACDSSDASDQNGKQGCGIEIVEGDNSATILNAIASSREVIAGKIKKNGKEIPARFFVTVIALHEGSMCGTVYHGGRQYYCCNGVCTAK